MENCKAQQIRETRAISSIRYTGIVLWTIALTVTAMARESETAQILKGRSGLERISLCREGKM